jgi:hypothetical protein
MRGCQLWSIAYLAASIGIAHAAECQLPQEFKTITIDATNNADKEMLNDFFCSHSYQEFNDQYGTSADGYYYAIDGRGRYAQGNFTLSQLSRCASQTPESFRAGFIYAASKSVSPQVMELWRQCKFRQPGLSCWAESDSDNNVIIRVHLLDKEDYVVSSSFVSNTATLKSSPALIAPGASVSSDEAIVLERVNTKKNEEIAFILNAEQKRNHDIGKSCSVVLPAAVDFTSTEPAKRVCRLTWGGTEDPNGEDIQAHTVLVIHPYAMQSIGAVDECVALGQNIEVAGSQYVEATAMRAGCDQDGTVVWGHSRFSIDPKDYDEKIKVDRPPIAFPTPPGCWN